MTTHTDTTSSAPDHTASARTRLSRYDEAVLAALRATRAHPTALELYERVRPSLPRIGLATVYRALQRLEASGLAVEVGRDAFGRHYDARMERHDHAVCTGCGRVLDLSASPALPAGVVAALTAAAGAVGVTATTYEIRLYGRCAACAGQISESGEGDRA